MDASLIPATKLEAIRYFSCEDRAHAFLVEMRWPEGVRCPHCDSTNVGKLSVSTSVTKAGNKTTRRVWNCKACRRQFTVKVKTIFEDSALPLSTWLPAVWMVVNSKNGVSSCELARDLGITQKSAWHLAHRVRTAMKDGVFNLAGEVEADESFIGAKSRNKHFGKKTPGTGPMAMTAVAGLLERNTTKGHSRVKVSVARSRRKDDLQANVLANVVPGSALYTDALKSYEGLGNTYAHQFIDHAEKYVEGKVHTNGLENFWSLLKRGINGTYVCPAPYHLFRYLDEQATRFNERKTDDSTRFENTLKRTTNRRLTYKRLTGKESGESVG